MKPRKAGLSDLLASSWSDWSGFFLWTARLGLVVLVLIGISLAADWTTLRLFGNDPSELALIGTQVVEAVLNGLAFAVAVTFLLPKELIRRRIRFSFLLHWIGFSFITFISVVGLPGPTWQDVAIKIALFAVGAAILWVTRNRWKALLRPSTDTEEPSHA